MNQQKEEKIIADVESLAQSLVDNTPAGSKLHQLGQGILLLVGVSADPDSRAQAVKLLSEIGKDKRQEMEKLLHDLGIRLN